MAILQTRSKDGEYDLREQQMKTFSLSSLFPIFSKMFTVRELNKYIKWNCIWMFGTNKIELDFPFQKKKMLSLFKISGFTDLIIFLKHFINH